MADERRIIRGELEDANGNVLHPNTSAGQVITADGKTIEDKLQEYDNMAGAAIPTGGTAGQLLAKQSDTDHDAAWIDPPETETAESILEKLKTVDGEGSGLDADMLGGTAASSYVKKTDIIGGSAPEVVQKAYRLQRPGGESFGTAEVMIKNDFVGSSASLSVNNADKLGNVAASNYMQKSSYVNSNETSPTVYRASNIQAGSRYIPGGRVVESLSSVNGLKISIVTSLPTTKASDTIYFVKE